MLGTDQAVVFDFQTSGVNDFEDSESLRYDSASDCCSNFVCLYHANRD